MGKIGNIVFSIIIFLAGVIIGWFTNHWYAIKLRQPKLRIGGGGGMSANFQGYKMVFISVQNAPRFILGDQVKRETTSHVRAFLKDADGKQVGQLFWYNGENVNSEAELISGESMSLILFVKANDISTDYYLFHPNSMSDMTPLMNDRTPHFTASKDFVIEVFYENKLERENIKVNIGYDKNLTLEYSGGVMGF